MFIGHFALGYAAKRWAPHLSLAVLFAAAIFADLLWPVLVALGIEHVRIAPGITASTPLEFISYPYSHSLLTLTLWARSSAGSPAFASPSQRCGTHPCTHCTRLSSSYLLLVVSHWVLDVVTHIPDMPLYPDGPKFGLGLWNSVPGTLAVETVHVRDRRMDVRARDDGARRHRKVGVCRRHRVSLRRLRRQRQRHTAAVGDSALDNGARARCADALARVVRRPSPQTSSVVSGFSRTHWRDAWLRRPAPVAAPRAAIWEDFIDIFYAPSSVFRRREHGSFFIPIAVITILCGVLFYLNSGALQPMFDAEFDRAMAMAMRQNPNYPSRGGRAHARLRHRACSRSMIFIFIPLAIFGVGVVTWLTGKLVDAKQTFGAALVVGAYAYAPRIIDGVLQGLQALFLDPSALDGRFRLSLGIGRFLDPDTVSPLLLAIVGRVDLITIWITVLVAIGLCRHRPHPAPQGRNRGGNCVAGRRAAADYSRPSLDVGVFRFWSSFSVTSVHPGPADGARTLHP